MSAARKQAFNRNAAIASIQINWKQMRPDLDRDESRDERLAWIGEFLDIEDLESITDLSDAQLGAVAGEMKRLLGVPSSKSQAPSVRTGSGSDWVPASTNVVAFPAGGLPPRPRNAATPPVQAGSSETSFAASHEQVYTLKKLEFYLKWFSADTAAFLKKRFKCTSFQMLRYKQAHSCTHQMLMIAAHSDLKKRNGGKGPVSRKEIAKYMPVLKRELGIDQGSR